MANPSPEAAGLADRTDIQVDLRCRHGGSSRSERDVAALTPAPLRTEEVYDR